MGQMKEYLMEKTSELAGKLGIPEEKFYSDIRLTVIATEYANYMFLQETEKKDAREEIKKAILARTDEVVELIQEMLDSICEYDSYLEEHYPKAEMCAACEYSFLCEASTEYNKGGE